MLFSAMVISGASNAQDYEVRSTSINTPEADFSGVFSGNNIIFCSTRAKTNLSFDDDSLTLYYTDLYVAKAKPDGTYLNPEPLKGNVNTDFNEGQATFNREGTKMYYTANLKTSLSNKFDKTDEYKLGIFYAELINGQWVSKGQFAYNALKSSYSNAHPCLAQNDSVLYFCSNMPGGFGKSDIYKCVWKDNQWSEPQNLGNKVNSKGNEFFPFVNEFNVLYFSTNARNDSEGMDIYYSILENGEHQKPVRLNNTINSPFDDFGYQERKGINQGCFSSNRNAEQDDIFLFKKYINTFQNCHENATSNFCYNFYDKTLSSLDSLPIVYEWIMGDGTTLRGKNVNHCYSNYGNFHVELNIVDTLTRQNFYQVSETTLNVSKQEKPFILSHDTVFTNIPFEVKLELISFDEFEIAEVKWELDDGTKYTGDTFNHIYKSEGKHQIKCAVSGKIQDNGITPSVCVYKDISCTNPEPGTSPKPLSCCDKREYEKISMRGTNLISNVESKQLKKIYKLIIAESKQQLASSDSRLTKIDAEISEIKTDSSYQYAIQSEDSWEALLPTYQQLREEGYKEMYTESYTSSELKESIQKIIPRNPENAIKLLHNTDKKLSQANQITFVPSEKSQDSLTNELGGESLQNSDGSNSSSDTSNIQKDQTQNNRTTNTEESSASSLDNTVSNETQLPGLLDQRTSKNNFSNEEDNGILQISENGQKAPINENTQGNTSVKVQNANSSQSNNPQNTPTNGTQISEVDKRMYRIVLRSSPERIPFNDPQFKALETPISEIQKENNYEYSIMATPKSSDLEKTLETVKANGFNNAKIESFATNDPSQRIIKTGKFIAPKDARKLNIEFSKLSDIKFEYNSAEIKPESQKNLNYIAAMLKLENDFTLKVGAHTCAIGSPESNQMLSEKRAQAVVDYFVQKGISRERLISHGYGQEHPLESNESEMGRIANRRVEFVIVFQIQE